ncbi:MAG: AAA-like domain-containing protein, partial [Ruminococcus sp.]|nr:AAA-like domain-containing protein [Ruminococcus sp.]
MNRYFNITGPCNPKEHYMVNLDSRLAQIKKMVDARQYFAINKGRQYGKTTMLDALQEYLKQQYSVIFLDFQSQMSTAMFENEAIFANAFADAFIEAAMFSNQDALMNISKSQLDGITNLVDLFRKLSFICKLNDKKIILMIDEVDSAANNQVFLDFLAQLRGYYLQRNKRPTFQSVILAGVHDIRNLRQKIRPDAEYKHNSPWNIASSFDVDMSFSVSDIAGMLEDYENDHHIGMNVEKISQLIYDYTSGYPVLVSTICKWMDEKNTKWTVEDLTGAVKQVIMDRSPLFESLINKLEDDETLRSLLYAMLFQGKKFLFSAYDATIHSAMMYGFVKNQNGTVAISNRIFETVIYDWFISLEATNHPIFSEGVNDKSQFIVGNQLNMEKILQKFVLHFNDIYGTQPDKFKEDDGRKLFLLYLRPIINGTGNYYIESQTRDQKRTDVIVDY